MACSAKSAMPRSRGTIEIATEVSGLPNTFVPGRNLLILGFAAVLAYRRRTKHP
ncbi:7-cyano-7-deazaguanine synthase [Mesorhizobium sp. LSHC412B00]|uniref:7-cyano-7-deazaguanine synthase n=1 Tax=Mesorhizobium sp. LSHC412B00 TaxID=1287285 RepID=UPI0003CE200B|nr:7-cyano-7-deazaguanine synthase [Mesorhizobium sp. LSHC412B00]ESX84917.1 hypothetical protein X756_24120 [Mesorhizobium sp. LSHC412B00]